MEIGAVSQTVISWVAIGLALVSFTVGGFMLYRYYTTAKRYGEFLCIIFKRHDNGNITYTTDKGGIFVEPATNNKRFFLKKSKLGLEADNIPFVLGSGGMVGASKIVFLLQTGLKNFRFITLNIGAVTSNLKVGEEDVNWALNSYEKSKKLFVNNFLKEYAPMIGLAVVGVIMLVMAIYMFKSIPAIKDLVAEIGKLASQIAAAKTGTMVMGG